MQPTSSFISKCVTVLIGMGLSWATLMNPQAEQLARGILGQPSTSVKVLDDRPSETTGDLTLAAQQDSPQISFDQSFAPELTSEEPSMAVQKKPIDQAQLRRSSESKPRVSSDAQIEELSAELKALGATYLRLERLTRPTGELYRVRCDLAGEQAQVKCCLEATRESAVLAMEDVLRAAREGISGIRSTDVAASI